MRINKTKKQVRDKFQVERDWWSDLQLLQSVKSKQFIKQVLEYWLHRCKRVEAEYEQKKQKVEQLQEELTRKFHVGVSVGILLGWLMAGLAWWQWNL